jgi:S-formylglutathione hydrolase FrmB
MQLVTAIMANCKSLPLLNLCRGLNDRESRTAFQHVANIGAKNVYRIFAGGNHSWVVIDDIVPMKRKYRPPSPVPDNKSL